MRNNLIIKIILSIILCLLIGIIGSLATQSSISTWYVTLNKPYWSPPNWIFAPVWISLYILMGIAVALVWQKGFYHKWVKTAIYHFGLQLIFNGLWSVFFFGFKEPFWALVDMLALLILVILTIKWFMIINKWYGVLLVPYLIWLIFAAALNFEIWRLN